VLVFVIIHELLHGHVRALFEEADLFKHSCSPHSDVDGGGFSLMAPVATHRPARVSS
jgi:hypothetical protein